MKESVDLARVVDALEALCQEVARLGERVAALEARAQAPAPARPAPAASAPAAATESFSEELILILSAAIAAYLGEKAPIRAIRLHGSGVWSQLGRVTIQASHERVLSRPGR